MSSAQEPAHDHENFLPANAPAFRDAFSVDEVWKPRFVFRVTRDQTPAPPHIPDYELLREIGRGSYGTVWLARSVTGLYRAVKIVWRGSFDDPQPYEREFRGIKEFAAVSLIEPRQLALLHVGRNDTEGFFYYVMELADDANSGRDIDPEKYLPYTLRELRSRRERLPADETLTLAVDLAGALAGLHSHKLVHRDIKPSNIIFVGGVPKLADLGLVTSAATAAVTISRVGNAGYMPPDFPGTPSADVYGLGKVLYEIATGRNRDDYPRLPVDLDKLPDRKGLLELNEIFIRACAPDPLKRYANAALLRDDLLLLQAGKSVRRLRAAEKRLGQALKIVAILGIATALAGGAAWLATREARKEMELRAKAERQRDELARRRTYSGNLASAQAALGQGDLSRARKLLQELEPKAGEADLRGFEWRALWHQARGDPHEVIRRRGDEIDKLAISPNEELLAVHDKSDHVTLYDIAARKERLRVPGVWKLAGFSADGKWLVGANAAQVSLRWSVRDGQVDADTGAQIGLPIVPLGSDEVLILTREMPRKLRRWNFATRQEGPGLDLEMGDEGPPWSEFIAGASPDGRVLVRAWLRNRNNRADYRLTCVRLGEPPTVQHHELGNARPAAVGVDATGPWAFFNPPGSEPVGTLWRCGSNGWAQTREALPRGATKLLELASASSSQRVVVRQREIGWWPSSGAREEARWARGHDATINELAVAARHKRVYSAAADGSLLAWDAAGPVPRTFAAWNSNAATTGAVFTADGKKIWVPEDGSNCLLLDVATLAPVARAEGMRYPVALSQGQLLGVGASEGLLEVDPATGVLRRRLMGNHRIRVAAVSRNGSQIAAIDHDDHLITEERGRLTRTDGRFPWSMNATFDPSGDTLWLANPNGRELVGLKWRGGDPLTRVVLPARVTSLQLTAGGNLLVSLDNGNLEFRSPDSGPVSRELYSGSSSPQDLAVSSGEQRLVVAGVSGDIHCFDLRRGEEIHTFLLGEGIEFHRLAWSPDGTTLAALTKKGTLHLLRGD